MWRFVSTQGGAVLRGAAARAAGPARRAPRAWLSTTTEKATPAAGGVAAATAPEAAVEEAVEDAAPAVPPIVEVSSEKRSFQAETASLLNIVSNALYTEREVFLRELLSNASDALEKVRQMQVAGGVVVDAGVPLEIRVTLDAEKRTMTLEDSGIGMTRDELATNLGTIALSGSKRYAESLAKGADASSIIGQFGVGFYSAFMVSDKVVVESLAAGGGTASRWMSDDGTATYTLSELAGGDVRRGSKITLHLKEDAKEYVDPFRVREVIKKYSNFVNFPILVDGKRANAVSAIWAADPKEVRRDEYDSFYKSAFPGTWDTPTFVQHFRAEAPLDVKALLYFPSFHTEKGGMARMEPSVSLYSRKILIESPCDALAPAWLRFIKGVVDSEDIPLSISREKSQDRRLLERLQDVLVRKVLRFLQDEAKNNRDKYLEWYSEFEVFLKEGACHDGKHRKEVSKILYFDSSGMAKDKSKGSSKAMTSLDEYVSRIADDEKIYYLYAPSRELAEASPYFEAFKRAGKECLFVYNTIDDFVMSNLGEHNGRKIVTAEAADFKTDEEATEEDAKKDCADAPKDAEAEKKKAEKQAAAKLKKDAALPEAYLAELSGWLRVTLDDRLDSVTTTNRLYDSPAVVTDAESGAVRRMMAMVSQTSKGEALPPLPKQKLLINPSHPIIKALHTLAMRAKLAPHDATAVEVADCAANQILDNALVAAGLMDDARTMLPRLNKLLEWSLSRVPECDVPAPPKAPGASLLDKFAEEERAIPDFEPDPDDDEELDEVAAGDPVKPPSWAKADADDILDAEPRKKV